MFRIIYKIILLCLALSVVVLLATALLVGKEVSEDRLSSIDEKLFKELYHFDFFLAEFVNKVEKDIHLFLNSPEIYSENDESLTNYLNVTETGFVFEPGENEQYIIELFKLYKKSHPQ
ncbi:hypothetical protein LCGC14_3106750, partial [marine sediment metagenome]